MAVVRFVLAKLKPGVDREAYERFEREVDYVVAGRLKSIVSYRTHRITEAGPRLAGDTRAGSQDAFAAVRRACRAVSVSTGSSSVTMYDCLGRADAIASAGGR